MAYQRRRVSVALAALVTNTSQVQIQGMDVLERNICQCMHLQRERLVRDFSQWPGVRHLLCENQLTIFFSWTPSVLASCCFFSLVGIGSWEKTASSKSFSSSVNWYCFDILEKLLFGNIPVGKCHIFSTISTKTT